MKRSFACVLAISALFTATPAFAEADYYLVDSMAEQSEEPATRAQAEELEAIYDELARLAGVEAKLVYSTDPEINAFATEVNGEKIVIVQEGLLASLGNDRDAVAATLGHELAHHKADHIHKGQRKKQGIRVFGAILGAVVGAKIGRSNGQLAGALGGAAVGVGAGLIALKFNRNQELEADRMSIGWMIAAGFNPNGMLRLQEHLGAFKGKKRSAMLSTHPTSAKRYKAAGTLIAKLAPAPELLALPVTPLVTEQSLAAATLAIQGAADARIAEVLKPAAGASSATALAPIAGISFDSYAALSNELLYVGDQGRAKLLAKHKLTDAKLTEISSSYSARLHSNPDLAARYSAGFFGATQGKLAAHGKDLADSYLLGQALKLEPPYPLETARALFAEMRARGAPNLDAAAQAAAEAEVLQAHGLSYYDFIVAHNWWSRKAKVAALAGDSSLLSAYYSAPESTHSDAAAANVRIGSNVQIGDNVRIGQGQGQGTALNSAESDKD